MKTIFSPRISEASKIVKLLTELRPPANRIRTKSACERISKKKHVFGSSLLTPTQALTAAHCLLPLDNPSNYSITAGSALISGDANAQIRTLNRLFDHPDFNTDGRLTNDIGLLYWAKPLKFGATVRPI